jgi:hypothetical protein
VHSHGLHAGRYGYAFVTKFRDHYQEFEILSRRSGHFCQFSLSAVALLVNDRSFLLTMVKFAAALLFLAQVNGFLLPNQHRKAFFLSTNLQAMDVPSMAQTHMQGPLSVIGSGKPLTKEELDAVKKELEEIKQHYNLKEPERSFMDDPNTKWRFGGAPEYFLVNNFYLKGRSKIHADGSLEQIVENLVKTWEMERSHKTDPSQHQSVDQDKFRISANGGKAFNNIEANEVGNYNVLLNACPAEIWDSENTSWEDSHDKFHDSFAAFPWEVLEVFSGPPKVAFTWRHWGTFTGTYEESQGKGELVEMFGFGTAVVNDKLQLQDIEIFYNAEEFINVLRGKTKVEDTNSAWQSNHACPFTALKNAVSSLPGL